MNDTSRPGLVLIAYDGSELAKGAVAEAGRELGPGRQALVLTVWQPFDVGLLAPRELGLDATQTQEVKSAAEQVATDGASLAEAAGFKARGWRPKSPRCGAASSRSPIRRPHESPPDAQAVGAA